MTVASYSMVLCGSSDDHRYRGRIEKVKFGVPINEAFAHDIPATLLMLLLKVNKDGPTKKDIWRAPGNQAQVRKLSQIMQHGRLVNIENFTVYTAASVIKKFLSKLPGGIFGRENEETLFNSAGGDIDKQRQVFYRIFGSLPLGSQHLLVLLFGTFKIVANSSEGHTNSMNPNAIAISVAPSLFHTCIHDGRQARVEDLQRFKIASNIVCSIICSFGDTRLFPRECYEYYARYTGRTLRIDENRMFTFHNPSNRRARGEEFVALAAKCAGAYSMAALHVGGDENVSRENVASGANSSQCATAAAICRAASLKHRQAALTHTTDHPKRSFSIATSAVVEPIDLRSSISCFSERHQNAENVENEPRRVKQHQQKPMARISNRLSASAGEVLLEATSDVDEMCEMDLIRPLTACGGDRSMSYLQYVHENQAKRMKSRSEWFLSPVSTSKNLASKSVDQFSASDALTPKFEKTKEALKTRLPFQNTTQNIQQNSNENSRRKSLKQLRSAAFASNPSHSFDYAETQLARRDSKPRLRSHTSVEADTWLVEVVPHDEIPKKRRSLKKKTSTQF
ncbi:unnamed protein product [Caenorhabditis bovis]|uniref:Rho-GAP domain-containing protein n=1 Tax=Caenorhabditis bovis TaxID=2654633 RepID=A0A8S1F0K4_9PELO|nr:unnamed protein product [Caenorhabditis bovis]